MIQYFNVFTSVQKHKDVSPVAAEIIIMKKIFLLSVIAASTLLFSCKSKDKDKGSVDSSVSVTSSTSVTPAASEGSTSPANEPKSYTVTFSPDSALLGKSKEVGIKLISGTATELADPDGKAQGMELSFKISVTNKNKIGGNSIGVAPSEFRLVLDNNNSISQFNGSYVSVEPESTKESETITYRLPAGSKPKTLNLFNDETRSSVSVLLK